MELNRSLLSATDRQRVAVRDTSIANAHCVQVYISMIPLLPIIAYDVCTERTEKCLWVAGAG